MKKRTLEVWRWPKASAGPKADRGAALILLCYVAAVCLSGLTATLVVRQNTDFRITGFQLNRQNAFYLAEAGVEQALDWFGKNPAPKAAALDPWNGPQAIGPGSVQATISRDAVRPDLYHVVSVGQVQGISQTVRSGILIPSFARYAYFSNGSSGSSWFGTGTEFFGPVHMNGEINIVGKPVFHDAVSSTHHRLKFFHGNKGDITPKDPAKDAPVFEKGLPLLNVSKREFPKTIPPGMLAMAKVDGAYWDSPTQIALQADGTMRVTNPKAGLKNAVLPLPRQGVVYVHGRAEVSGTLSGRLTVVSSQEVFVTDHLTYASDPLTNKSSKDMLGVLSHGKIVVDRDAPANLRIDGVLMSLTGGLTVDRYNQIGAKGNLTLLGSLLEHQSHPKGLIDPSSGTLVSGYKGKYIYDQRTAASPPPGFPSTGKPIEMYRVHAS